MRMFINIRTGLDRGGLSIKLLSGHEPHHMRVTDMRGKKLIEQHPKLLSSLYCDLKIDLTIQI